STPPPRPFPTRRSSDLPAGLDWDLWLGPAPQRPYSEGVHPFQWRKFWDYGTGALGDFGCHFIDLVQWALDLHTPMAVSAEGPPRSEEHTSELQSRGHLV